MSSSATLSRYSPLPLVSLCTVSGSPMMSPQVILGFREPYGSWKMICMRRRTILMPWALRSPSIWPSKITSPAVDS